MLEPILEYRILLKEVGTFFAQGIVNLLKLYRVGGNIEDLLKEQDAIVDKYKYYTGMKKLSSDHIVTTEDTYEANKDKLLIIGEGNSLIDDFSLNSAEFDASKNDDLKKETKKIRTNLPELFK